MNLDELRQRLNQIDTQMLELIAERQSKSREIALVIGDLELAHEEQAHAADAKDDRDQILPMKFPFRYLLHFRKGEY